MAGVPDLDGDERDELAVGSPAAGSGQVHVIFGTEEHDPIDAGALGDGGYTVSGPSDGSEFGASLAVSSDLDGDGLADLLAGAPLAQNPAMTPSTYAGAGYVIYGQADSAPVAAAELAADEGAVLYGAHFQNRLGLNVAAVGDVDGNGLQDFAFGGWTANFTGKGELRLVQLGELPAPPDPDPGQPVDAAPTPPATVPSPAPPPPRPSVTRLGKTAKVNGKGIARVAKVSCPAAGGACTVKAPKQVTVKIAGQRFQAKVLAPKRLGAGKSAVIRVKLGTRVIAALDGKKLRFPVTIRITNEGRSA